MPDDMPAVLSEYSLDIGGQRVLGEMAHETPSLVLGARTENNIDKTDWWTMHMGGTVATKNLNLHVLDQTCHFNNRAVTVFAPHNNENARAQR